MQSVQIGVSVFDPRQLETLRKQPALATGNLPALLADRGLADLAPVSGTLSHLYFGSEFCEHLFPTRDAIRRAAAVAAELQLGLVLATPAANDALLARIDAAVASLPEGAEVLVNDWGVASFLHGHHPHRCLVAGRQLAKMIKDPRMPSAEWSRRFPGSYATRGFRGVLARLGIGRIELDVPPGATPEFCAVAGLDVSVWAPYAYVAKGRICKIGSQGGEAGEHFAPGRPCHRECLGVIEAGIGASAAGLVSFARGNSIHYRHSAAMGPVVRAALAGGRITRLVLNGV